MDEHRLYIAELPLETKVCIKARIADAADSDLDGLADLAARKETRPY
jgi:hypothetical protein